MNASEEFEIIDFEGCLYFAAADVSAMDQEVDKLHDENGFVRDESRFKMGNIITSPIANEILGYNQMNDHSLIKRKAVNEMTEFFWLNIDKQNYNTLNDDEKYQLFINWAGSARGQNPTAFDELTEWILNDEEWSAEKLAENKQILMQGVIARFKEQNAIIRAYLKELTPSGAVNEAVFKMLDSFDDALLGKTSDKRLCEVVSSVFADFSTMKNRDVRKQIAGNKTGAFGTDSVEIFGYINYLENCDASVQWALFMPQAVLRQQNGFKVKSFEYKKLPAMRFIGKECMEHDEADMSFELEIMHILDNLHAYKSGLDYDVLFQHHYGLGVDKEKWHGFWGRFMKADTPVPDGFVSFDFIPQRITDDFSAGPPYISQFAYAVFKGDIDSMHRTEGYDSDAMYDVTRNIILGQGVKIPYPDKYWTAEVFLDGCENPSNAYMFSTEL